MFIDEVVGSWYNLKRDTGFGIYIFSLSDE